MSLRMLWSLLTIVLVATMAVAMMGSIGEVERSAWKNSEEKQARLLITLLSDELKMPMVAVSVAEVDNLINMFMHEVPGVRVFLRWTNGETEKFGEGATPAEIEALSNLSDDVVPVDGQSKWYATGIKYNSTQLGTISMFFSGASWRETDRKMKIRLTIAAAVIALVAMLLVYALSGRVVKQLRLLARASKLVGSGDFTVHLPIQSDNEFGKAFHQFNHMVSSLEHREKVYDLYGQYQRPQLVADEYDRNSIRDENIKREVSVIAVDMIDFGAYMEQGDSHDAIAVLNRCFSLFQQIVQEFGGHVDHVIGDKLIAVFNHPFALNRHENHAAKAGIAIIKASEKMALSRPDGSVVTFRVGLAIGEVAIGHLGVGRRKGFTIVGAPVALAAQLAKLGDGKSLTAPYRTMLSLGHDFKQKDLGLQTIRNGKDMRCINILPGEAYVNQEIEQALAKALVQAEPEDIHGDEGW